MAAVGEMIGRETLTKVIQRILAGEIKNVICLTGAGVSTATGIPDFRSAGGLYDTLKPELLTATAAERAAMKADPTHVVSWQLFKNNQLPYLELRRPFIMGVADKQWKPTLAHFFFRVLHDKGLLRRLYTQNIDGFDFELGLPEDKLVHVHGSLGEVRCEFCDARMDSALFRTLLLAHIRNIYDPSDTAAPAVSTPIACPACQRPGLKPATVLYGRPIPRRTFACLDQDDVADLVVVTGTSLTVSPACEIPAIVSPATPRILINQEKVGANVGLSFPAASDPAAPSSRDIFLGMSSDQGFLLLLQELGWLSDIMPYIDQMNPSSATLLRQAASSSS